METGKICPNCGFKKYNGIRCRRCGYIEDSSVSLGDNKVSN